MKKHAGSIICVGPGITVGAHMSTRTRNLIEAADIVFTNCHPLMHQWIEKMHPSIHSLQHFYAAGKNRRITYQQMHDEVIAHVRDGKQVVGVFYGHPGIFAKVPHELISTARKEGYEAHMEPGISAEDCLYADMGIDPGYLGCQHYEASQLMFYKRRIDPTAYLILWQIALAGDISISKKVSTEAERELLVELLTEHYSPEHNVAIYECPTLISETCRIEWLPLKALPTALLTPISTLVVPPGEELEPNLLMQKKLLQLG